MKKPSMLMIALLMFLTIVLGCAISAPDTSQQPSRKDDIINIVAVKEQPLSEINTEENDFFASNYHGGYSPWLYKPYLDDYGGIYYYIARDNSCYLYYDDIIHNKPIDLGLPSNDYFTVATIIDGVIYGVERRLEWTQKEPPDGSSELTLVQEAYIEKYTNGKAELLLTSPVEGCYFAEEGIYYQVEDTINLMEYDGSNSRLIVEIPPEMYYKSVDSSFIVYREKLWYSYNDFSNECPYQLWCFDFDKTFTKFEFTTGEIELAAANNGFLYYTVLSPDYNRLLYRFNCETYHTELVSDEENIGGFAFTKNCILFTAYENGLFKLDNQSCTNILRPNKLGASDTVLDVWVMDDRIYVLGGLGYLGPNEQCYAETDIDGNVIKLIHEDT